MPRILILTQVFPPEIDPTAVMVRELSQYLAACGWDVEVIAGYPQRPYGRLFPGYTRRLYTRECDEDVKVLRTWHLITRRRKVPFRIAMDVSKALATTCGGLFSKSADIVLVYGPPIVGPILGGLVAKFLHAKMANMILDLYPDVMIDTGRMNNSAVIAAAKLAESLQYRVSDHTFVLSDGFKQTLVKKNVPAKRIDVIPVWLDPDEIRPLPRDNAWRREQVVPLDKTIVLYAGTIGIVSGAAIVVDSARELELMRPDILFLFVGEGQAKAEVEAGIKRYGLTNIRLMPFQPRERLSEVQATADISLVSLAPGCGKMAVPSKVISYMAAGRPIIASVDADTDTARQITTGNAGLLCKPGDPTALAQVIGKLSDDLELRYKLGQNARHTFETLYSKYSVLKTYEQTLRELLKRQ